MGNILHLQHAKLVAESGVAMRLILNIIHPDTRCCAECTALPLLLREARKRVQCRSLYRSFRCSSVDSIALQLHTSSTRTRHMASTW